MSLRCQSVAKNYGSVVALKDANLQVNPGEIRALLGGNGSGKSTLAKAIGGIIKRSSGTIEIDGKIVDFTSPDEAKKHRVVVASQELSLFNNLTVAENIMACALPQKHGVFLDRKQLQKAAVTVLDQLGLSHIIDTPLKNLPANHKYMVEFAKTLVQKPYVLILDEITSPLYREDVETVKRVMHELKQEGCIILFISHRMHELFDICDTVTVMKDGVAIADKKINETTPTELLALMTGLSAEEIDARSMNDQVEEKSEGKSDQRDVLLSLKSMILPHFGKAIDLTVKRGDFVGIAGLQGHGQSDLIRSIYGLQSKGEFTYKGKLVKNGTPRKAAKNGMAFISGDRTGDGIYPIRSVSENVKSVSDLIVNQKIRDVYQVLDQFKVKYNNQPKHFITSLSGGNQQKVVVARWLVTKPDLLLADDPTKGIDVQARYDLHKSFVELTNQGTGVVMVSSDDEELVEISHMAANSRVLIMYEGKIVKELTGEAITAENILAYSFA